MTIPVEKLCLWPTPFLIKKEIFNKGKNENRMRIIKIFIIKNRDKYIHNLLFFCIYITLKSFELL